MSSWFMPAVTNFAVGRHVHTCDMGRPLPRPMALLPGSGPDSLDCSIGAASVDGGDKTGGLDG